MAPALLTAPASTGLASHTTLAPRPAFGRGTVLAVFGTSLAVLAGPVAARSIPDAGSAWLGISLVIACLLGIAARLHRGSPAIARRLGAYTLDEKIGEGGMGIVYKASHALLQRPAAIKFLPPGRTAAQNVERFEREVQLTSMLSHPNTVSIYDFGRTAEGTFYYAMEYVDGLDLQSLVERDGPQDPGRVAHLLAQLCSALAEAHAAGLVHRDVKPANVMLCERGTIADVVKLLDFGLIQHIEHAAGDRSGDQPIAGTPLYMSPEALTAPERVDARSDLYAVGTVGYFLLTGRAPFTGSLLEVFMHHLNSTPLPPSERTGACIPHQLEALILSCLQKAPEDRPASAGALASELRRLAASWTDERATHWWAAHARARSRASHQIDQRASPNRRPHLVPAAA